MPKRRVEMRHDRHQLLIAGSFKKAGILPDVPGSPPAFRYVHVISAELPSLVDYVLRMENPALRLRWLV